MRVTDGVLQIAEERVPLTDVRHIEVIGGGKAGAGMARGVEAVLAARPPTVTCSGWVNVPDDCAESLDWIHLHPARPASVNEPTEAGVRGTEEILRRAADLGPKDLCLVLLSGGGSALLPAPVEGVSLDDKRLVTRLLAAGGASIGELNAVRARLSRIKAGGLARACRAGRIITLIISDVIGDPLDVIASGPTFVSERPEDAACALEILKRYDTGKMSVPSAVVQALQRRPSRSSAAVPVTHHVIGSNARAVDAAAAHAAQLGYIVESLGSANKGPAADLGQALLHRLQQRRDELGQEAPWCLVAGGETTVRVTDASGRGGRNQHLVLAAIAAIQDPEQWRGITLLSAGTDGEDGPTPAAGAVADRDLVQRMRQKKLDPAAFLEAADSWSFFHALDGLIVTGPTHTNVMDIQVGLWMPGDTEKVEESAA